MATFTIVESRLVAKATKTKESRTNFLFVFIERRITIYTLKNQVFNRKIQAVGYNPDMKSYAQMCPLAVGLDRVGDRWTLLIVRELLIRENLRFRDLQDGLPGIATNLLSSRLEELQGFGLVERSLTGYSESQPVYNLTEKGRELEGVVIAIAKWGSQFIDPSKKYTYRSHWFEFAKNKRIFTSKQVSMAEKFIRMSSNK
jgi:DNA-binding HxlR family transcriptional regulator